MHNMLISQLKTIASVREDKIFQDHEMNSNTTFLDLGFSKVEVDTERYRGRDFDKEKFKGSRERMGEVV